MMSDFFTRCSKMNARYASDGMGGLNTRYEPAEDIQGLVVRGSYAEHNRGSEQTAVTHSSVFHTFRIYDLKHNDVVRYRGKLYRMTSDPILPPDQAVDSGWCSFTCEEVPE